VNIVFSRQGLLALRNQWLVLFLAALAAAAIVAASLWLLERERRETAGSGARMQEARARVENARHERDSLQESSEVFRTLVERGMLQSERRLELVELVNSLRARHLLYGLDYEIAPQRPLKLAGGRVFPAVDVLASRVTLKMRALHEGDVLDFIDALSQSRQGFYPVDRCTMRRVEPLTPDTLQPRVDAQCALEWITLKEKRANRPG
jgi:hypothetical protein